MLNCAPDSYGSPEGEPVVKAPSVHDKPQHSQGLYDKPQHHQGLHDKPQHSQELYDKPQHTTGDYALPAAPDPPSSTGYKSEADDGGRGPKTDPTPGPYYYKVRF